MKYINLDVVDIFNNSIFFLKYNSLMKINIDTQEIIFVSIVPKDILNLDEEKRIVCWNKYIFILPVNLNSIAIFDVENGLWKNKKLKKNVDFNDNYIICGKQNGKYYYGIGKKTYTVIEIDLEMQKLNFYKADSENQSKIISKINTNHYNFYDCCVVNNKLFSVTKSNFILIYDFVLKTVDYLIIGSYNNKYSTICFDGEFFWVSDNMKHIIRYNYYFSESIELKIEDVEFYYSGEFPFRKSLYSDGYVFFFSSSANKNMKLNVKSNALQEFYAYSGRKKNLKTLWVGNYDKKIIFEDGESSTLIMLDNKSKAIQLDLSIDKFNCGKLAYNAIHMTENILYYEKEGYDLNLIIEIANLNKKQINAGNNGKNSFRNIMKN